MKIQAIRLTILHDELHVLCPENVFNVGVSLYVGGSLSSDVVLGGAEDISEFVNQFPGNVNQSWITPGKSGEQ